MIEQEQDRREPVSPGPVPVQTAPEESGRVAGGRLERQPLATAEGVRSADRCVQPLVPPIRLQSEDLISVTPDLYFSRRGEKVLVVEPESASWGVLSEPHWRILRRLVRGGERVPPTESDRWQYWARFQNPGIGTKLREIQDQDSLSPQDFESLLQFLYRKNFIQINGEKCHDPSTIWKVQRYPHYINVHMTEACNLACRYCRVSSPVKAPRMSPDLAEQIVRRVVAEIPSPSFLFGPHGGEPLLNVETVLRIARVAKELGQATGKSIKTTMQTNGTLLRRTELCQALLEAGVDVGVSIDGPQAIHDENRVFRNQRGSFKEVMLGISTARSMGHKLGFLAVIHNPVNYVKVLDFFAREIRAHSVRINYSAMEGRARDLLEFPADRSEAYARNWLKMADFALEFHRETGIWLNVADLNLFIFHLISKERPHMCYRSPCGAGNSILGIGHEGNIYLCDELVGNEQYKIGNILESGNLKDLLDSSPVLHQAAEQRKVEKVHRCSTCVWKRFHGGPCLSKTVAYFGEVRDDPMCRYYHLIFEELMWKVHENPGLTALVGNYGRRLRSSHAHKS